MFGKEPGGKKILSTPIRISKEMVEPLGGIGSTNYQKFEKKLIESYLYLRNKSQYILNLIYLMIDSGLKDLPLVTHQRLMTELY